MYDSQLVESVKKYSENNKQLNVSQISKIFNLPRATVRDWIKGSTYNKKNPIPRKLRPKDYLTWFFEKIKIDLEFRKSYFYLLGQYLGDGYIDQLKNKRTYRLRIAACNSYPNIKNDIISAIKVIFPDNTILRVSGKGCEHIGTYNCMLPFVFPHIGNGVKYLRKIELSEWQIKNINYQYLAKGLFHSDGCRYLADKTISLRRPLQITDFKYNFVNCSIDIINIYILCLDNLNIKYRTCSVVPKNCKHMIKYTVATFKKVEVEKLYVLFGEKT